MAKKYIYFFGKGKAEGNAKMRDLLGGKGANLAEMTNLGIPVPPGFTISTQMCIYYSENRKRLPQGFLQEVKKYMEKVEKIMGRKFGDRKNPLLVSVRSGAAISMPGMMDTILNLGLTDTTIAGLINQTNDERFAYDSYRRFIQMFSDVVLKIDKDKFEKVIEEQKEKKGVKLDIELDAEDWKEVCQRFKEIVKHQKGKEFPQNVYTQLKMAILAVFESWNNPRAVTYRNLNKIPHHLGTAVNVQAMVFGNMGKDSGTGVAFTRNPSTGEKEFYGEFLLNAQGEDVVAGIRTPQSIEELKKTIPSVYKELFNIQKKLEAHFRDMQDLEFTIEKGKLYLLQTRKGKRTAQASIKIAVDMVKEKLISEEEAVKRVDPLSIDQLLHPTIDSSEELEVIAKGLAASPGAAVGKVVFTAEEAIAAAEKGEKVILVRKETSPEDVGGMAASQGILTSTGGLTSHAAVVGRGMGKPCVVGCSDIVVNEEEGYFKVDSREIKKGDFISIDGSTGEAFLGKAKLVEPKFSKDFMLVMKWADKIRKLGVRANADTPKDAEAARNFGAEGIGLCRTEHMFFGKERLPKIQKMILSKSAEEREKSLQELLPLQKEDFKGIFRVMKNLPVTIRLLDPPLHEFLPKTDEEIRELSENVGVSIEEIKQTAANLREFNPMLGFRGCRLGIVYPEIVKMQALAIFEAAAELKKEKVNVEPEVMVPLVGELNELQITKSYIDGVAKEVMKKYNVKIKYSVGTMIEVPRASLTADKIAEAAKFFSFGTNDLTQMTFGFSRDDAGRFLKIYLRDKILGSDPFISIDEDGVGKLIKIGVELGRKTKPDLKIGICGEQGGDPQSVKFCHKVGLDYVSCSPFRVPVARIAAAHAALEEKEEVYGKKKFFSKRKR
ncbi:MAG: pyruvate, phosphate dikinase [Candidatus Omnitrophica bacterium 4484_70.1]|nr:MAG: pyruvate, phosphate dikinase [Candidatus Omnitrophica bacterium 4484_70.1]